MAGPPYAIRRLSHIVINDENLDEESKKEENAEKLNRGHIEQEERKRCREVEPVAVDIYILSLTNVDKHPRTSKKFKIPQTKSFLFFLDSPTQSFSLPTGIQVDRKIKNGFLW
jgi:hypothetical protein